jgi:hypothetical protein
MQQCVTWPGGMDQTGAQPACLCPYCTASTASCAGPSARVVVQQALLCATHQLLYRRLQRHGGQARGLLLQVRGQLVVAQVHLARAAGSSAAGGGGRQQRMWACGGSRSRSRAVGSSSGSSAGAMCALLLRWNVCSTCCWCVSHFAKGACAEKISTAVLACCQLAWQLKLGSA